MAIVQWDSGRTKTLVIPSGQTESNILDLGAGPAGGPKSYRRWDITVLNVNSALTGTVNVFVSNNETNPGNFVKLNSGGAAVTIPVIAATPLVPMVARFLKLVSSVAEGADRTFILMGVTTTNER